MIEKTLERIKMQSVQTEETLDDALGLVVQLEDTALLLEWCRWVRREAMNLRTAGALEIVRKTYFLGGRYNLRDLITLCRA